MTGPEGIKGATPTPHSQSIGPPTQESTESRQTVDRARIQSSGKEDASEVYKIEHTVPSTAAKLKGVKEGLKAILFNKEADGAETTKTISDFNALPHDVQQKIMRDLGDELSAGQTVKELLEKGEQHLKFQRQKSHNLDIVLQRQEIKGKILDHFASLPYQQREKALGNNPGCFAGFKSRFESDDPSIKESVRLINRFDSDRRLAEGDPAREQALFKAFCQQPIEWDTLLIPPDMVNEAMTFLLEQLKDPPNRPLDLVSEVDPVKAMHWQLKVLLADNPTEALQIDAFERAIRERVERITDIESIRSRMDDVLKLASADVALDAEWEKREEAIHRELLSVSPEDSPKDWYEKIQSHKEWMAAFLTASPVILLRAAASEGLSEADLALMERISTELFNPTSEATDLKAWAQQQWEDLFPDSPCKRLFEIYGEVEQTLAALEKKERVFAQEALSSRSATPTDEIEIEGLEAWDIIANLGFRMDDLPSIGLTDFSEFSTKLGLVSMDDYRAIGCNEAQQKLPAIQRAIAEKNLFELWNTLAPFATECNLYEVSRSVFTFYKLVWEGKEDEALATAQEICDRFSHGALLQAFALQFDPLTESGKNLLIWWDKVKQEEGITTMAELAEARGWGTADPFYGLGEVSKADREKAL